MDEEKEVKKENKVVKFVKDNIFEIGYISGCIGLSVLVAKKRKKQMLARKKANEEIVSMIYDIGYNQGIVDTLKDSLHEDK